jgi:hypothetical protein
MAAEFEKWFNDIGVLLRKIQKTDASLNPALGTYSHVIFLSI